jgi:hypothetical protein
MFGLIFSVVLITIFFLAMLFANKTMKKFTTEFLKTFLHYEAAETDTSEQYGEKIVLLLQRSQFSP